MKRRYHVVTMDGAYAFPILVHRYDLLRPHQKAQYTILSDKDKPLQKRAAIYEAGLFIRRSNKAAGI